MQSSSASPIGTEGLSSLVFVVGVGLVGAGVGYGALLAIAEDIAPSTSVAGVFRFVMMPSPFGFGSPATSLSRGPRDFAPPPHNGVAFFVRMFRVWWRAVGTLIR
jgi:hypothetical protein